MKIKGFFGCCNGQGFLGHVDLFWAWSVTTPDHTSSPYFSCTFFLCGSCWFGDDIIIYFWFGHTTACFVDLGILQPIFSVLGVNQVLWVDSSIFKKWLDSIYFLWSVESSSLRAIHSGLLQIKTSERLSTHFSIWRFHVWRLISCSKGCFHILISFVEDNVMAWNCGHLNIKVVVLQL